MPNLSYDKKRLIIKRGGLSGAERQIRDIQRDLRQLGYLKAGIDELTRIVYCLVY